MGVLILLTVGDIPRLDRHELQCILDEFHANRALQAECREILCKDAGYLVPDHTEDQSCCFAAKIDTPACKRLTLYAGRLSKFSGNSGTHYICMGDIGLGYPLIIDGLSSAGPSLCWANATNQPRVPASRQRTSLASVCFTWYLPVPSSKAKPSSSLTKRK